VTNAPAVYKNIAYDPVKDLTAIGPIQSTPMVITAAPKTPVTTYKELVALSQAKGGQVTMASAGNGSSNHLAIELLSRQANLKLVHVPYKGSGPAITDMLGSQVETMMDQLSASIGHIREGRFKALAVESVRERYRTMGVEVMDMTQPEFTAFVRTDYDKWRGLAKEANIVVE
jgi:tripartite-type tricarboxylate transporter receptor subunit TctC